MVYHLGSGPGDMAERYGDVHGNESVLSWIRPRPMAGISPGRSWHESIRCTSVTLASGLIDMVAGGVACVRWSEQIVVLQMAQPATHTTAGPPGRAGAADP